MEKRKKRGKTKERRMGEKKKEKERIVKIRQREEKSGRLFRKKAKV